MSEVDLTEAAAFRSANKPSLPGGVRWIRQASSESNRSNISILFEYLPLSLSSGRLSPYDYLYDLGLHLRTDLNRDEKRSFVSVKAMRTIWRNVNHDRRWKGLFDDKFAFECFMRQMGFNTTRSVALFCLNGPISNKVVKADKEAMIEVLSEPSNFPLFGKPIDGTNGLGSICLLDFDEQNSAVIASSGRRTDVEQLADAIIEKYPKGYVFQELLLSHPDATAVIGETLATLRITTAFSKEGPELLSAVWKLPGKDNSVDNWAAAGTMLADVDINSGEIKRVVTGRGVAQQEITLHPSTNKSLVGFKVPEWSITKQQILMASELFKEFPLVGWDVAPTKTGALIVEANCEPDLMLPQVASGRGIRTKSFRDFHSQMKRAKRRNRSEKWRDILGASSPGFLVRKTSQHN